MDEDYFWKDGKLFVECDGEIAEVVTTSEEDCCYGAY